VSVSTDPPQSQVNLDAKVLVLSSDGNENDLPAISRSLDYALIPYQVVVATKLPPASLAALLSTGSHGNFAAIILTTDSLSYSADGGKTFRSALSQTDWLALWNYEASFVIRQVTFYSYPSPDLGFGPASAIATSDMRPHLAAFHADPMNVFGSVNRAAGLRIKNAYTYLARPATPATGETISPLVSDAQGHALVLYKKYADGRENIALTFDSNPFLVHTLQLSYDVVNWVTRGFYVGEHRISASAQVDDLFIPNDEWPATDVSPGLTFRMNAADLTALVNWQSKVQSDPLFAHFRLDLAFNGVGTMPGQYVSDDLTAAAKAEQGKFKWISHTWSHKYLDALSYADTMDELLPNNSRATWLGLSSFDSKVLITPNVSGLGNPSAMRAVSDSGVRFVVSDTSVMGQDNPLPNIGLYNSLQSTIFEIPRRPVNLYYNVTNNAQWVAEYNALYAPGGRWPTWDHPLTFDEMLDKESDILLQYLLRGELDPWMFHQANLRAGAAGANTPSTLGELLDRTFAKYRVLLSLPIQSPTMLELGTKMKRATDFRTAGVRAVITPGKDITLTAAKPCHVPITGSHTTTAELYGGQYSDWIYVTPDSPVTVPFLP